jgi:hypothetical protein
MSRLIHEPALRVGEKNSPHLFHFQSILPITWSFSLRFRKALTLSRHAPHVIIASVLHY